MGTTATNRNSMLKSFRNPGKPKTTPTYWKTSRYIILQMWKRSSSQKKFLMVFTIGKLFFLFNSTSSIVPQRMLGIRWLQRDVVYLGWPIAPSYMRPNAGGGRGGVAVSQPMSTAGAQINFGDPTPYLTYSMLGNEPRLLHIVGLAWVASNVKSCPISSKVQQQQR